MAFYLGIDGGGTKTRCVLGDETKVVARAMTGGSNIVRLGEAQARESLHAGIRQVCAMARISPGQICAVCIGAAGAARSETAEKLRCILTEVIPGTTGPAIEIVGDTEIALEAAFRTDPGVIAIAGTGSVVYGRDADGHTARAGGWGFAISDEGSGHWTGRRAVSAILMALDRKQETALTAMVLNAWKLGTIEALVQQANSTPPPDFPRLFPIVLAAANEGDAIARNLLTEAGTKLGNLAAIVVRHLVGPKSAVLVPVAMTGSVFRQSLTVRQIFYNKLEENFPGIEVLQNLADPVEGALARARRM